MWSGKLGTLIFTAPRIKCGASPRLRFFQGTWVRSITYHTSDQRPQPQAEGEVRL